MRKLKNIIKSTVLLLTILLSVNLNAQADSLQVHTIKGKEYYIHIVEKGESLYFIHKKYNVPIAIIKKENPSVLDGLSIGEKVFIPLKKDVEYELKTNGNFLNHTVKKKQTLYSIAKLYDVKIKAIVTANPDIDKNLKEGETIKIPVLNIRKAVAPKFIIEKNEHRTHIVKKGETLYSLSKLYKTSVDSIKSVNGGLKQGLKRGKTIYIPKTNVNIQNQIIEADSLKKYMFALIENVIDIDSVYSFSKKKSEYKIALMLPFYLDTNDEMVENRNALDKKRIYPKSKFAIEFYNGIVMALDSITTDSSKFKLYVYDTNGNDSLRIKSLLLKPEMEGLDLIIGPLHYNNFKQVSQFAKEHQIPIVSPVKQSNKLLLGNQFIFKVIPSKSTTIKEVCTLVVDSFKTENLLAVAYKKAKEKSLVDLYIKTYNNQILSSEDTAIYSAIKTLKINTNISDVVSNLSATKNNVIFIPASDQTFITNLFSLLTTTLNKKNYKDYKVTLIGLEEWVNYDNIDLEYFQKLNVHYCTARFIEDKDSLTTNFVKTYVSQTGVYPSEKTFLGFDLAYYFGNNLINYGSLFTSLSLQEYKGLSINLNFYKTGIESGFENMNSYLLNFNDYTLKRIH